MKKEKKQLNIFLKIFLWILGVILLVLIGYISYVLIAYYRVEDFEKLDVKNNSEELVKIDTEYKVTTYNIGFGAYTADFSFFMDGGDYSRAYDKKTVIKNMNRVIEHIQKENPDIALFEEVDTDSDRAWHVNEYKMLEKGFKGYSSIFAQNYDSPYLFYPVTSPHGASTSGLVTLGKFKFDSAIRRQLPIETSLWKILDLDRCYSKVYLPVENGKMLVVYTTHMSAYTKTPNIATDQVKMLLDDMQKEYDQGNYVLAGGDFNKDLLGDTSKYTGINPPEDYTWNKPFPVEFLNDKNISLYAPLDEENPLGTCRDSNAPLSKDTYLVVLDGFLVSDNIEVTLPKVIDTGFDVSDHNPVSMTFTLRGLDE